MIRFSVIVPFYRGNKYLPNIFRVVEANTRVLQEQGISAAVELILVNDSPEETVCIPEGEFSFSCSVIPHEKNSGIHQARVTGLSGSSGEFIHFLDQDDEVEENFLFDQYSKIQDADVIICGALYERADGSFMELYNTKGKRQKLLVQKTYLKSHVQIGSPGQCLIRASSIPVEWTQNIMKVSGADDFFLWMLMFEKKMKFLVNPNCLYRHRYTGANLSDDVLAMARSSLSFVEYLDQIPYVDPQHTAELVRSRNFDIQFIEANGIRKIIPAIKNADIIMHRAYWKIKCLK